MQNRRMSFDYEDLLACGRGELFKEGPQLPLPPMLCSTAFLKSLKRAANMARA